jgi:hypothetical protein
LNSCGSGSARLLNAKQLQQSFKPLKNFLYFKYLQLSMTANRWCAILCDINDTANQTIFSNIFANSSALPVVGGVMTPLTTCGWFQ